jgi:N-acetylglucosamine-6-phosphate deacetylase
MDTCVRNLAKFTSLDLGPAIVCATRNPAEMLGGEWARRKGNLRPGADADLVLLDRSTGVVLRTWIMGQVVYSR